MLTFPQREVECVTSPWQYDCLCHEEYALAAEYLYYLDRDLDQGNVLITQAIALQKELWYCGLKMDILERQKKFSQSMAVADEAIQWIDSR